MNKKAGIITNIIIAIIVFLVGTFMGKFLLCKYGGVLC